MTHASPVQQFQVSLKTTAGELSAQVEAPTGFIPITHIVPLLQRLGSETVALEERRARAAGAQISCQKGCAACCRMLVPVSAPEAFALRDVVDGLPEDRRRIILKKFRDMHERLEAAGLLDRLRNIAECERQLSDEEMEPINHDYYALRLPCPFLEQEICSIYEARPAACRELLVTSPAELCRDIERNPVRPLPVPLRASTALGLLWSELRGGPARLIPLPVALEWAERHAQEKEQRWSGLDLLDKAFEKVSQLLSLDFAGQAKSSPEQ